MGLPFDCIAHWTHDVCFCYQMLRLYRSKGLKVEAKSKRRSGTAEALGISQGSTEGVSHNADLFAAILPTLLIASHLPHRGNCQLNKLYYNKSLVSIGSFELCRPEGFAVDKSSFLLSEAHIIKKERLDHAYCWWGLLLLSGGKFGFERGPLSGAVISACRSVSDICNDCTHSDQWRQVQKAYEGHLGWTSLSRLCGVCLTFESPEDNGIQLQACRLTQSHQLTKATSLLQLAIVGPWRGQRSEQSWLLENLSDAEAIQWLEAPPSGGHMLILAQLLSLQ